MGPRFSEVPIWSRQSPSSHGPLLSGVGVRPWPPRQLTPAPCSFGICRSLKNRSSGPGGSRRSCAAGSRACGSSWNSSGGPQGWVNGSGCGQTAWTPQASLPSALTQTKVSALRQRGGVGSEARSPDWTCPCAEELEVDVESLVFGGEAELLQGFSAGQEHSYSHSGAWL